VSSASVVVTLDPQERVLTNLDQIVPRPGVNELFLGGCEERFGDGIGAPIVVKPRQPKVSTCAARQLFGRFHVSEVVSGSAESLSWISFGGAAGDISNGGFVESHTDDEDATVGPRWLAVAAFVEAVTVGSAGGSRDGAGAAQFRQGGLALDMAVRRARSR
jgi:hypothetical protein